MSLKVSLAELAVFNRMQQARRAGVATADLLFAQRSDIDPEDVAVLRAATRQYALLIVLRCPKRGAAGFHGIFGAKRWADGHDRQGNTVKSGLSGLGVHPDSGRIFVSDYDMMSLWKRSAEGGWRKLFASALTPGAERGPWSPEAMAAVRLLNPALRSPLQHGAQDDFTPPEGRPHPGVRPDTRFAAFREGEADYLDGMAAGRDYYAAHGLSWPYDAAGHFTGARPG